MHMGNEFDHIPTPIGRNLTSEGLRSDLADIAFRFRAELKGLADEGVDGLTAAVLAWLERAEMRDPDIVTTQSLLKLTDQIVALRNSRLVFTQRRIGDSVVVELVGDRGGAVPVDALQCAVRVAVSRHDPVLGRSLAQRADETHRRHIAEMAELLSS